LAPFLSKNIQLDIAVEGRAFSVQFRKALFAMVLQAGRGQNINFDRALEQRRALTR